MIDVDQSDLFVRTNVRRLAKATLIRPNRMGAALGGAFFYLKGDSLINGYCNVQPCALDKQAGLALRGTN